MRIGRLSILCTAVILRLGSGVADAETPLGTAFTYQGRLNQTGGPVNGTADFEFNLWDAETLGNQVGFVGLSGVTVSSGLFTVPLDFGAGPFGGDARWLQIAVRFPAGSGSYTPLSPRQPLTAAPYALKVPGVDGHSLDAADGDPVDGLFVDNIGNVGIGTASPATTLDLLRPLGDPQVGIGLQVGGSWKAEIAQTPASSLTFRNGGQDRMVLSSAGKLGIGTTAPDQTLHVHKGSAGSASGHTNAPLVVENNTHSYINILSPDASERGILFGDPTSNIDGGVLYNSSGTPDGMQFRTSGNITRVVIDASGKVGIGTISPTARLHAEGAEAYVLRAVSTATGAGKIGVYGETQSSSDGAGVFGRATHATGLQTGGVWGINDGADGYGVYGQARSTTGSAAGVRGETDAADGRGVIGVATSGATYATGVYGSASAASAIGIWGGATHTSGSNIAVGGQTLSPNGYAGYFKGGRNYFEGNVGIANASPNVAVDVIGSIEYTGTITDVSDERLKENIQPVAGALEKVRQLDGVHFNMKDTPDQREVGLIAQNVRQVLPEAVRIVDPETGYLGVSYPSLIPVIIEAVKEMQTQKDAQIAAQQKRIDELTARLEQMETMIAHPDDPENEYLLHYAAESPEVINFYRGTVVLDNAGEAVVELPQYFATINKTPSYQLAAVGAPMPNLHVADEISEAALNAGAATGPGVPAPACSFRIAGGAPGAKVSWEVKAVRNDPWVRSRAVPAWTVQDGRSIEIRSMPVEVKKQDVERGMYQHPEFYEQPKEQGMDHRVRRP